MNLSDPFFVAVVGYLGVITSIVGQIYVANKAKQIEDDLGEKGVSPTPFPKSRGIPKPAHPPDIEALLKRYSMLEQIRAALIAFLLICLTFLAYLVFQPGGENKWFRGLHASLIPFVACSCVVLLALLIVGRKLSSAPARGVLYFVVVLVAVALGILISDFVRWQWMSAHEQLIYAAWEEYKDENFDLAITAGDECVGKFGETATSMETNLVGKPLPPTGKVLPAVRESIFQNGVLNDVATCYWVKGQAWESKGDTASARKAYDSTVLLPHARTFDPKGDLFWSPAEEATNRLSAIK